MHGNDTLIIYQQYPPWSIFDICVLDRKRAKPVYIQRCTKYPVAALVLAMHALLALRQAPHTLHWAGVGEVKSDGEWGIDSQPI